MRINLILYAFFLIISLNCFSQKPKPGDTIISKKWVRECLANGSFLLSVIDLKDSLLNIRAKTIQTYEEANNILKERLLQQMKLADSTFIALEKSKKENNELQMLVKKTRRGRKWYFLSGFGSGILFSVLKPP